MSLNVARSLARRRGSISCYTISPTIFGSQRLNAPRRLYSSSAAAAAAATSIDPQNVSPEIPPPQPPLPKTPPFTSNRNGPRVRPDEIVATEINHLKQQIALLLSSGYPGLDTTSKYYLQSNGKLFRPMVVFLMSRATSVASKKSGWEKSCRSLEGSFNTPIAPKSILADLNPDFSTLSSRSMPANIPATGSGEPIAVLGTQRRLAEIVELIHTASLLHDDVIDHAETRRGMPSANAFSGNKLSILAGDYMLGRASLYLARLREPEVIELMAEVIAELVKGELFQLRNTGTDYRSIDYLSKSLDYYLQKTYLKSASLISKSCRASAVLGGATEEVATAAYTYGKHMGLAFQLIDDVLDYTGSNKEIGKPANADLELGLATAPVFYAWEEFPELGPMIARNFNQEGDAAKARALVHQSKGIQRTRELAHEYCQTAREAISAFPDTEASAGLEEVLNMVLTRKK